jgi:hypothetical protein
MQLVLLVEHTMAPSSPSTSNATAGPSNAPASTAGSSTTSMNPAGIALPVSALTISNGMFSTLSNDSKFSNLCLSKDNWPKWSQKILEVMEMSKKDNYLLGIIPQPDPVTDPTSHKCWKGNNNKVIGFLKAYVEDREKTFVTTKNVHIAWKNLMDHHEKQGPITQVHLIQEVLSIYYPKDVAGWSTTTNHIRDICTQIFAQAVPTFDVLFMVTMLNALESEVDKSDWK